MNRSESLRPLPWAAAACLLVAAQSGCTSALTTTYLRDGLWAGSEHAAEGDARPAETADAPTASDEPAAADTERREAALEEAMARLSRLGPLDPAVEAAIVASLQRTEPEDWPVVVEEFAASLAAAAPAVAMPVEQPTATLPSPVPAAATPATACPVPAPAATVDASAAEPAVAVESVPDPAEPDPEPPVEPQAEPAPPSLAVRNACFASAVRGWGDVVRFAADRFAPGQEVIVYVELDNLSSGVSPAGQTTCIDAVVRLVDDTGRPLHAWSFEPIAETRTAPRRDYFARYVVRLPESLAAGPCRVELEVTDTLAGSTAAAALPLEIGAD